MSNSTNRLFDLWIHSGQDFFIFLWKVQMNLINIWAPLPNLEIRKPFLKIIFKINNFFPLFLDLHLPNVKYVGTQNIMELYVVFVDDAWPNGLKKETKSLYIWFMWHCNVNIEIFQDVQSIVYLGIDDRVAVLVKKLNNFIV